MIASRDINDLDPVVAAKVRQWIGACAKAGIDIIITSTFRDFEAQGKLYAQGRGTPGPIVTNARPGESKHQWHVAADFCPIEGGKAAWNDSAAFTRAGQIAESFGLQWAGRWQGPFRELAHVEFTGGLTLADLQQGKKLTSENVA